MSYSRMNFKPRTHTAPRSMPSTNDPNLQLIKARVNKISSHMRQPLRSSNSSMISNSHLRETRIRTPPSASAQKLDSIENFLSTNGFADYTSNFQESQLGLSDLPFLTKEDLIDLKIPIGPRNRMLRLIETMDKNEEEQVEQRSPKRTELRDEVDKFMNELSQFSRRSEAKVRQSSREHSNEESFEAEVTPLSMCEAVMGVLKAISEKQVVMQTAVEENQKAIVEIGKFLYNRRYV